MRSETIFDVQLILITQITSRHHTSLRSRYFTVHKLLNNVNNHQRHLEFYTYSDMMLKEF